MNTREDILKMAREAKVEFIRLQFTDIFGVMKNVSITTSQLEKALDNELMFDGSSIDGFVRIEESDMYLYPDYDSWCVIPWLDNDNATARLICDIYTDSGEPFVGDPRYVLRRAIKAAADMGYTVNMGPEAEFFLFHTDEKGRPTLETNDRAAYFDLAPVDLGEAARREMVLDLESIGFEIEASHHEVAPGQHEIDFKYADALTTADNLQTFKYVVRQVAQRHGLHATFMPKPVFGIAGSGMHVNQSLMKDGKNAFYDPDGERGLSRTAYQYLAGLLAHSREFTAITNSTVNSFKRLVSGYEAPVYVAWAGKNRSPLVRVPAKRGNSTRMELRSPDPSCNPYLAFACMIMAGLDGIKNDMTPPEPVERNIFCMSEEELAASRVEMLPGSLAEAIELLKKSSLVRETLGDHIFDCFIEAKHQEWEEYRIQVTDWELNRYLNKF
ncbi:MAG: type I glutamate--ammonia ligase [Firmicutes bacterium]|nr:type I glutamate--ammonia ligase [Bacillota bacterium]